MARPHIIVAGAGQAAASFAAGFRALDATTPLTIIGDEPVAPYQRPPLSKRVDEDGIDAERLLLRPLNWYGENDITLLTGTRAAEIDRAARHIVLDDGRSLPWSTLVLATGSRARTLPQSVTRGLSNIHTLRSLADAEGLAAEMVPGRRMVIIGGGYIGLEAAALCRKRGLEVTLVEAADRILQRVACPQTSDYFRALHQEQGAQLREGTGLTSLDGDDGALTGVTLSDGTTIKADCALVGIGILPNADLADAAGLTVDGGIVVDEYCRTDDSNIYAVGDCATFTHDGLPTRLESVPNAIDQGETAARNVAGQPMPYIAKPWFWSDQYDVKLQIAGLNRGYDNVVVRPGERPGSASHFTYRGERLLAVDAMNDPRSYMVAKRLLEAGRNITREQAADPTFDLKALLRA